MQTIQDPLARWRYGLAAALALVLSGCGSRTGEISGAVRLAGKPLTAGFVTFASQAQPGVSVSSLVHEDGSYRIADCPLGPVKIAVKAVAPHGGHGSTGAKQGPGAPPDVPARYARDEQSGLDYIVTPGRQQHDIELAP